MTGYFPAQARSNELHTYIHSTVTGIAHLQWMRQQMGEAAPPQLAAALESWQGLYRMLVMALGALELVAARGWGMYNSYTHTMRPYAANPPPKWVAYDWRCAPHLCDIYSAHIYSPLDAWVSLSAGIAVFPVRPLPGA